MWQDRSTAAWLCACFFIYFNFSCDSFTHVITTTIVVLCLILLLSFSRLIFYLVITLHEVIFHIVHIFIPIEIVNNNLFYLFAPCFVHICFLLMLIYMHMVIFVSWMYLNVIVKVVTSTYFSNLFVVFYKWHILFYKWWRPCTYSMEKV